jgi:hypothetical protein
MLTRFRMETKADMTPIIKLVTLFSLAMLLIGCSTVPRENHQQAYGESLTHGQVMMFTLRTLDAGDVAKTRRVAMTSLYVALAFLPIHAAQINPTPEQKQEELALARDVVDYMLLHRNELDPRYATVRMGMKGLQKILTEPEDTRRLGELSDYLSAAERKLSSTAKPRARDHGVDVD